MSNLEPIFGVLRQFGGFFTFADEEGNEYVVATAEEFYGEGKEEKQLALPAVPESLASKKALAEELLERVNREIAMHQLQQTEEEIEELSEAVSQELVRQEAASTAAPLEPIRVRFESIRGDLPPELQE